MCLPLVDDVRFLPPFIVLDARRGGGGKEAVHGARWQTWVERQQPAVAGRQGRKRRTPRLCRAPLPVSLRGAQ